MPGEELQRLLVEQPRPHHCAHVLLIILKQVQIQVRRWRQELRAGRQISQHPSDSLHIRGLWVRFDSLPMNLWVRF